MATSRNLKNGTHKHSKGYLRVSAGPLRNQYIHRIVAAAYIGRDLRKDEEVDHSPDPNKLNFHFSNLVVRGSKDHGWKSAKQASFLKIKLGEREDRERKEWEEWEEWEQFMRDEDKRFRDEVREARAQGKPWRRRRDGTLQKAWRNRKRKREPNEVPF